jgi:hypothetical protein
MFQTTDFALTTFNDRSGKRFFLYFIIVCLLSIHVTLAMDSLTTSTEIAPNNHLTLLSGNLPEVLTLDKSPYLVEADVFVTPGTTVTIESGVVLLFSNFTGLHIQGTLYVKGVKDQPVVFTSRNDPYYNQVPGVNAAPYDWNGIDIYENAIGTTFDNTIIQFSVYGIRSQTEHIKIINSYFLQNGKSNLSVKSETFEIGSNAFSYNVPVNLAVPSTDIVKDSISPSLQTQSPDKKKSTLRSALRYSGLVLALGGIGAGVFQYQRYADAADKIKEISETNDHNMLTYTSSDWKKANQKYKDESAKLGLYGGIGVVGLLSFVISFTF